MKKYKCKKVVEAFQILAIDQQTNISDLSKSFILSSSSRRTDHLNVSRVNVSEDFMKKHKPVLGSFFVRYEDGYESCSPAITFVSGYSEYTEGKMNFGEALESAKNGNKVQRSGWNGKGIFVEMQVPDENSKMTSPYLYIDTTGLDSENKDAPRCVVAWLPSQTDVFAEDWEVIKEQEEQKEI